MIRVYFLRDHAGRIREFEFTGHADAGPYGSDVVCAGVSALAISTVNGIEALAGVTPEIQMNEEGGYLNCQLHSNMTQEQLNISQILLENLYIAMQGMTADYPEYIEFQVKK